MDVRLFFSQCIASILKTLFLSCFGENSPNWLIFFFFFLFCWSIYTHLQVLPVLHWKCLPNIVHLGWYCFCVVEEVCLRSYFFFFFLGYPIDPSDKKVHMLSKLWQREFVFGEHDVFQMHSSMFIIFKHTKFQTCFSVRITLLTIDDFDFLKRCWSSDHMKSIRK